MLQNIFDNEKFHEKYKKIRGNPDNANIQEVKPACIRTEVLYV